MVKPQGKIAIWALTASGARGAQKIQSAMPASDVFISAGMPGDVPAKERFGRLSESVGPAFAAYSGHVFFMSTGIVVRMIAPLIRHKTIDPAVVVVDESCRYAISLLSGHLGGSNALTLKVADILGARPIITTATDVRQLPAIDVMAKEKHLHIENPNAIKSVSMAFLRNEKIDLYDPYRLLSEELSHSPASINVLPPAASISDIPDLFGHQRTGVFVGEAAIRLPPQVLVLRPASLAAGIGCNRGTDPEEILDLLERVFTEFHLAADSLKCLASIDLKADEAGLIEVARKLKLPLEFFTKIELDGVKTVPNPSDAVRKHIGVQSVCEAAAILASQKGNLIVPKQKTRNVTVAIAQIHYTS
jgi:cobalt-precorrin 5A hydrolase